MILAAIFSPAFVKGGRMFAYDFRKNRVPSPSKGEEPSYWRDLGTIEAYYDASMDLCSIDPSFNLYNRELAATHGRLRRSTGKIRLRLGRPPRHGSQFDRRRRHDHQR